MEHLLEEHGVKVTANRLLVARALAQASAFPHGAGSQAGNGG